MSAFVSSDGRLLFDNPTQFVDAFEQTCLAERVHGEFYLCAIGQRHRLRWKIDLYFSIDGKGRELRVNLWRHHDRQQRILESVALEDIGEAGADDCAETELRDRPGSMFSGTAAAE